MINISILIYLFYHLDQIKTLGFKGLQSQTQGEQVRVTGKKRDDLQSAISKLKENDFGIPIQCGNFRD